MDELLLVLADSRRGTRAPQRRGAKDREDGARGWEDPGGKDGGCRAEEELLSFGLDEARRRIWWWLAGGSGGGRGKGRYSL